MIKNSELQLAYNFVQYTNQNLLITGKAGTGKTAFLRSLKMENLKRMVVVAPTGVAAINAGGVTIHSFFQIPLGPIIPNRFSFNGSVASNSGFIKKMSRNKINIIKTMDLLIIDEISMLRADLLDGIDQILRYCRKISRPFGGVQLLMIGDLQQLAPVTKKNELKILSPHYDNLYFFNSKAFKESNPLSIELTHIFRQNDQGFIKILNEIRDNNLSETSLTKLNKRYRPNYKPSQDDGFITLTTHNGSARRINEQQLERVKNKTYSFIADISGQFPQHAYPTEFDLTIKVGAQVMFVRNDCSAEKRFFNGKIGTVSDIAAGTIYVKCPGDSSPIVVEREIWQNIDYSLKENNEQMEERVIGTFSQYPLRLAWAITIHKSQGLTFDKAVIDVSSAFTHGQVYVALSRCRSLDGLILTSKISPHKIMSNYSVTKFSQQVKKNIPSLKIFYESRQRYQFKLIRELFNYHPIHNMLNSIRHEIQSNSVGIDGVMAEKLKEIEINCSSKLISISNRFLKQISMNISLDDNLENNSFIQERIAKASAFFSKQNRENLLAPISQGSFQTDNKGIEKRVNELSDKLLTALYIKQRCFSACSRGFYLKDFLNVRARAMTQNHYQRTAKSDDFPNIQVEHSELYSRLLNWRKDRAEEISRSPNRVLPKKVILMIVSTLPQTPTQLKCIKGLGTITYNKHGEQILLIVNEYCKKKNLKMNLDKKKIAKPDKCRNSRNITIELYREGKSIKEIAKARGLATSTIKSHLAYFVGIGVLEIGHFVKPYKINLISQYFENTSNHQLREAKKVLGNRVTYSELLFVLKHLQNRKQAKQMNHTHLEI